MFLRNAVILLGFIAACIFQIGMASLSYAQMPLQKFDEALREAKLVKDQIATMKPCGEGEASERYLNVLDEYLHICNATDAQYNQIFAEAKGGIFKGCSWLTPKLVQDVRNFTKERRVNIALGC